ncbi:MAG: metallophosphoesterase [Verrucomicrobiales bacterium]
MATLSLAAEDKLGPMPPDSFSIVVVPDTQAYRGRDTKAQPESTDPVANEIFEAHVRWISENIEKQNIAFVSHVGDIVDKNSRDQWKVARACMDAIHDKVPYGISVGNHDMTSRGDSSLFQEYFPASRFEDFEWYGGSYPGSPTGPQVSGNNANSYQLFSAGGIDFVFLHLECNAPDDVLEWANAVLEEHADRKAWITTHMGWGPRQKPKSAEDFIVAEKGRMEWLKIHGERGNTPQQMWDKCFRKHENLFMVLAGDQSRTQAIRAATPGDHGNVIHEVLQDYSTGWLRQFRFLPAENRIDVVTFDPRTEELCEGTELVPDRDQHQFRLEFE